MPQPPRLLLWTDTPGPYIEAIAGAGLAGRVAVESLARKDQPSRRAARRNRSHARLGRSARAAAAHAEAALGAGADRRRRGLDGAAGPSGGPDPHLRARHARRVDAGEHPRRAVPPHQALRGDRRGPEATALDAAGAGAAERQDARHPRPRRHRAGGGAPRRRARHAGGRHASGRRALPGSPAEVLPPERTAEVLARSDFVLLLLPATPETENFMDARAPRADEAHRLAPEFRPRPPGRRRGPGRRRAERGRIAGAVLDVFRQEPLPTDHPFWTTDGIVVLPHIGGLHPRTRHDRRAAVRRQPGALPRRSAAEGSGGPRPRATDRAALPGRPPRHICRARRRGEDGR